MPPMRERPAQLLDRGRAVFERLLTILLRYKRFLPIISFATGIASALLMKRGYSRIPWLLGALFVTWAVVGLVMVLGARRAQERPGLLAKLHFGGIVLAQSASQEVLFFVLPFYYWSTTFWSPNVIFFGLLVVAVVATLIDPLFEAITRWPPASLILLALSNFAALNFVLPVVFGLRNDLSLHLSLLLTIILVVLFASYARGARRTDADAASASDDAPDDTADDTADTTQTTAPVDATAAASADDAPAPAARPRRVQALRRRLAFAALLSSLMAAAIWFFDLQIVVPPVPLRIVDGAACAGVVDKEPLRRTERFVLADGPLERVFCFTAIQAPRGLKERISHRWIHDGAFTNQVELNKIAGGRQDGYRTWSFKRRFPADPRGRWICEVRTGGDQIIGRVAFDIVDEDEELNAEQE